ncbi:putative histidyl-tRNA synthetase [Coniella lustricola]|uniref:histidine--tRNA ligase n=1 Tax=Coniella lustricola TaxID=2025994 RepID=A0A2T3A430_9PEZI|nr:putative histidyl-tRNA synthetase [Coniella lustricola]
MDSLSNLPNPQSTSRSAPAQLKTPKGTLDFAGNEVKLRKNIFRIVSEVFECHGGQELDTPVFELKEILSGKYGEDSRLIYDLQDQGGELCSLRYDLTVPFARWLAMNTNYTQVSRYQIAKVYRRDQPAISRGRYREFYQCDFDIAGKYEPMIPDAEILLIAVEAFQGLEIDVTIKINHRKILDGILAVAGVKQEMVQQKGLTEAVADDIGRFVRNRGTLAETLTLLKGSVELSQNEYIKAGIDDMSLLYSYLRAFDVCDHVSFDLSLARGLDYYTGVIFEVVTALPESKEDASQSQGPQVGSIAAGGRYDYLVGMYCNRDVPCVGISFGVERIYTILSARLTRKKGESVFAEQYDVFVVATGAGGLLLDRMAISGQLTRAGIRAGYLKKTQPSLRSQLRAAEKVPLSIILGFEELAAGNDEKDRGQLVARQDLVKEVKKILERLGQDKTRAICSPQK